MSEHQHGSPAPDAATRDAAVPSPTPAVRVLRRALVVGPAGDRSEREADAVADAVISRLVERAARPVAAVEPEDGGTPRPSSRVRMNPAAPVLAATRVHRVQREVVQRAGLWEWLWGYTKGVGEGLDTGSASLEAVDETHKSLKGLTESSVLAGGTKTVSDVSGVTGGLVGGIKDVSEGVSQMSDEGLGVRSGMKASGGTVGIVGAVNKGLMAYSGEGYNEWVKNMIGIGGEEIAGWLDFVSGGTKVVSGAYLTGTAQLQYNKVKAVQTGTKVPQVRDAATKLMEVIDERWWAGMWEMGLGTMDMAATTTFPGYTAMAKGTGAVSKVLGGDLLWEAVKWMSGGRIRTNDDIENEINAKLKDLGKGATAAATAALRRNDGERLKEFYLVAKDAAPEYATKLATAVRGLPNKEFKQKKQAFKGVMW